MKKSFLKRLWSNNDIPPGVRALTRATAIRWIGWGFAESLIPVFLFSFGKTYATTGLLASAYDIAFLLFLPVAGVAADRFRLSGLVIVGLFLYFFIGSSYFLAGFLGLVVFAVIARFINGIAYSLDALGRETYTRRFTPKEKLATVFGYVDTVTNFWWIAAAIAGIFLVKYFSIHFLLFLIVPTSLIALWIVWRFRVSERGKKQPLSLSGEKIGNAWKVVFQELTGWQWKLRILAMFNFFVALVSAAVGFFLPIESYVESGDLGRSILISVLFTLPMLFGWVLGKLFDNKGISLYFYGFIFLGLLLACLGFSNGFFLKLAIAFGIGVILELLSVGSNELITACANPEHFGRVGSVMRSVADIGSLSGPLLVGVLIDWQGPHIPFFVLAGIMFLLGCIFLITKRWGIGDLVLLQEKYHHRVHGRR